jgi:predicted GH43/DUF377 family glycosyl hydrolase
MKINLAHHLVFLSCFLFPSFICAHPINLESAPQNFIEEIKQIQIPSHPHAFNPSLIQMEGKLLMSFRSIENLKNKYDSTIGLVFLNDDLEIISKCYILPFKDPSSKKITRVDDVRLVDIAGSTYIVYADNPHPVLSRGGYRVYTAKLNFENDHFFLTDQICLSDFPDNDLNRREKNWVPFDCNGSLLLAYSLTPHRIYYPIPGSERCELLCQSDREIQWNFGELRGGTPALAINPCEYLCFFHSSIRIPSVHTDEKNIVHYFMGAYTFSKEPPFAITKCSPTFLSYPGFYSGPTYTPYWQPVKVVFPCGFVIDQDTILLSYGRDDHECWIAKLSKSGLLQNLTETRK